MRRRFALNRLWRFPLKPPALLGVIGFPPLSLQFSNILQQKFRKHTCILSALMKDCNAQV
jgi:hypothetical protein